MRLIYAFIRQFRNIMNQEILFSDHYTISYDSLQPFPESLTITARETSPASDIIFKDSQLGNVHIFAGKTGSGKTNILQMIGMPEEERIMNLELDTSYFLLYEAEGFFVIEPYSIPINSAIISKRIPPVNEKILVEESKRMPDYINAHMRIRESMDMYKFFVDEMGKPVRLEQIVRPDDLGKDHAFIFNGYERHAFPYCPYEETRFESIDSNTVWQTRVNAEYHKTALWNSCRFLKEYIDSFAPGNIKRRAALVINCQNWAGKIKQHIDGQLEAHDYWTFIGDIRNEAGKNAGQRKCPAIRHQFVHDMWTDFALYLREWISYIEMYPDEIPEDNLDGSGRYDVYQEFLDYYFEKEQDEHEKETGKRNKNRINPAILPDFEDISILKRLEWLSMWIDRRNNGVAQGLLWQIYDDIKDIGEILGKFDDRYFTNTAFTLPIEEMYTDRNRELVETLFERMEQYRPDDAGIFASELLPYHFSCISSGEYQFAKILGGVEEFCVKLSIDGRHPSLIYLLDEPETYMHPELCRTFLRRLDSVLKERSAESDIQILISTHSPLLLSDVLPEQITRLDLDSKGYCIVKNGTDKACFGANIHTILSDGFFLDYTIGESARVFLQEKFDCLKEIIKKGQVDKLQIEEIKQIVPLIGDAVIRRSFEALLLQMEMKND